MFIVLFIIIAAPFCGVVYHEIAASPPQHVVDPSQELNSQEPQGEPW